MNSVAKTLLLHPFRISVRFKSFRVCSLHSRLIATTSRVNADPWPLPHTPEHLASTTTPSDAPRLPPLPRLNEPVETMRARLHVCEGHLATMSEQELKEYDQLLDEPDWDIYYWATGKRTPPERWRTSPVLQGLRVHAKNEGKVVRSMPAL
ncbi:DUF339-domain-containing protein [Cyathus striatus]|nr:DUF339-domain-containing protein [Cyathus striatus]